MSQSSHDLHLDETEQDEKEQEEGKEMKGSISKNGHEPISLKFPFIEFD